MNIIISEYHLLLIKQISSLQPQILSTYCLVVGFDLAHLDAVCDLCHQMSPVVSPGKH